MKVVLVDTGPIVAFLNRRDRHHEWAVGLFEQHRPPMLTCEAALSGAVFLLRDLAGGGEAVMKLATRGVVHARFDLPAEAGPVGALLRRYGPLPMDLADACLVRMSELHPECVLLTVDSEFRDVYRRNGRQVIPTVLPGAVGQRRTRT